MVIGVVVMASGAIDAAAQAAAAGNADDPDDWPSLSCFEPSWPPSESVVEGRFTGGPEDARTRIILSADVLNGCGIRHEDGEPSALEVDRARIAALCRDPVSGRDHVLVHAGGGSGCCPIEVWSVDEQDDTPKVLYSEQWGDSASWTEGKWSLRRLVADDGTCLWRQREGADERVAAALAALGVGERAPFGRPVMALPTREIPAATVRDALRDVERLAILERPVYTSRADWDFWRVVQVVGDGLRQEEEMPIGGVVLLLDRSSGTWRAIYDVPGASGKRSDFRLLGMMVDGDRLYAGMCYSDCGHWGAYQRVVIDLRTNRATLVGTDDGIEDQNPPVLDLEGEIFAEGPYPY